MSGQVPVDAAWAGPPTAPSPRIVVGRFWHQGPPHLPVLHLTDPARHPARYRRAGGPGAWYASSTAAAAWSELRRHARDLAAADFGPRRLAAVAVEGLSALDLTDPERCAALGLSPPQLTADAAPALAVLGEVGAWACARGLEGILAPSAALAGCLTLVVFASGLPALTVEAEQVLSGPPDDLWPGGGPHANTTSAP